jgi:methylenetetrahydrofolate reductase (NADPH)
LPDVRRPLLSAPRKAPRLVLAAVCAEQVIDLIDHGVEELHFTTMNRADPVFAIWRLIGLRAKPTVAAEAA